MKFNQKIVLCNIEDAHRVSRDTELEWLSALLLRLKLDPKRIQAIMDPNSDYGNQAWRDYLVLDNHISISKNGATTIVEKHFEDRPRTLLGKWEKPELVRVKDGDKWHAELRLKYWQLI